MGGEEAVRQRLERHAILRTAWVFSARGSNFVRTMWRLAHEREVLRVVDDQTGHPTWAGDLAESALLIAEQLAAGGPTGTVHVAGTPSTTWHGLAEAVVETVRNTGSLRTLRVEPISSEAYPTAARRPREVVLSMQRVQESYGIELSSWRQGVARAIGALEPRMPKKS